MDVYGICQYAQKYRLQRILTKIYAEAIMTKRKEVTHDFFKGNIWAILRETVDGAFVAYMYAPDGTATDRTLIAETLKKLRYMIMIYVSPYIPNVIEHDDYSDFLESWL